MSASSWSKCFSESKDKKYFLACSGGVDSMVLCFLLQRAKFNFEILHVNFQLRGQDSLEDEKLVLAYGAKNKIPVHVKRVDALKIQQEQGGNLEELCRDLRYAWFQTFLDKTANARLLVAHHLNDQIETFYLQLARKAGIVGLSSLKEVNGKIMRPLLDISKDEIYTFAKKHAIPWREDTSNHTSDFTRNKLRNAILPFLEQQIKGLNQSVLTLITAFQLTKKEMETKIQPALQPTNHFALPLRVFKSWTADEVYVFLTILKIKASVFLELKKLETAIVGKFIETDSWLISRSSNGFFFAKKEAEKMQELILEELTELPKTFDKTTIYLDKSKIKGELILRKWQEGDRIAMLGVNGSKRVSKVINEAHLSVYEKRNTLVLADAETIHWVVGIKIGRKAIATKETAIILKVQVRKF